MSGGAIFVLYFPMFLCYTIFDGNYNIIIHEKRCVQLLMNQIGATQGIIPIPQPIPIPAPTPLPVAGQIPPPLPIQPAGVLPPLMGTAGVPTLPVAALAKPLVTGESTPPPRPGAKPATGARPQAIATPKRMQSTQQLMGMPATERFWGDSPKIPTTLPKPEDYWWGTRTTSQIYLPTPEEFWRK